jgi:hypothetical protein
MGRVLPILFNSDMVRSLLEGRKTATRRKIDISTVEQFAVDKDGKTVIAYVDPGTGDTCSPEEICRYKPGDILYVRETWSFIPCIGCNGDYVRKGGPYNCYDYKAVEYDDGDSISDGCFVYRADCEAPERITWHPSIHMPKQAARIWLEVMDVEVKRLQDISTRGCYREGVDISRGGVFKRFAELWDSTIKKTEIDRYGWRANPWVWVIRFDLCRRPEGW